jgi:hypothetical protein
LYPPFDGEFKKAEDPLTSSELFLVQALLKLLQDDSLRMHYKEMGTERIQGFRTERILDQWMEVLQTL